jgi:hypothetical protein
LKLKRIVTVVLGLCLAGAVLTVIYRYRIRVNREVEILKSIVKRLEADTRLATVIVTDSRDIGATNGPETTIKFLEYDIDGKTLDPKYFRFTGNIIQFQSLVIRFNDIHIRHGDRLKDKSAYLFWKVFMLDGRRTEEYVVTEINAIPSGYKLPGLNDHYERDLWQYFWNYALNSDDAGRKGIKNAQIEAPGTRFIPGMLYTIRIEHDGGLRIDSEALPDILRGETLP